MEDYEALSKEPRIAPIPHYYGDSIRNLFLIAAALLMASVLIDKALFAFYLFLGVFMLLGLVILAGLTSPFRRLSIIADTFAAGGLFIFFEYSALLGSSSVFVNSIDIPFILRQLLAIIFLLALYFCIKTLRGMPTGTSSLKY